MDKIDTLAEAIGTGSDAFVVVADLVAVADVGGLPVPDGAFCEDDVKNPK
jgi:hypothetical protein